MDNNNDGHKSMGTVYYKFRFTIFFKVQPVLTFVQNNLYMYLSNKETQQTLWVIVGWLCNASLWCKCSYYIKAPYNVTSHQVMPLCRLRMIDGLCHTLPHPGNMMNKSKLNAKPIILFPKLPKVIADVTIDLLICS